MSLPVKQRPGNRSSIASTSALPAPNSTPAGTSALTGPAVFVRVLHSYDYFSNHEKKHLYFNVGEEYRLLAKTSDTWWLVTKSTEAESVYIPASYVEEFKRSGIHAFPKAIPSPTIIQDAGSDKSQRAAAPTTAPKPKPRSKFQQDAITTDQAAILEELDAILDMEETGVGAVGIRSKDSIKGDTPRLSDDLDTVVGSSSSDSTVTNNNNTKDIKTHDAEASHDLKKLGVLATNISEKNSKDNSTNSDGIEMTDSSTDPAPSLTHVSGDSETSDYRTDSRESLDSYTPDRDSANDPPTPASLGGTSERVGGVSEGEEPEGSGVQIRQRMDLPYEAPQYANVSEAIQKRIQEQARGSGGAVGGGQPPQDLSDYANLDDIQRCIQERQSTASIGNLVQGRVCVGQGHTDLDQSRSSYLGQGRDSVGHDNVDDQGSVHIPAGWTEERLDSGQRVYINTETQERWKSSIDSEGRRYFYNDLNQSFWRLEEVPIFQSSTTAFVDPLSKRVSVNESYYVNCDPTQLQQPQHHIQEMQGTQQQQQQQLQQDLNHLLKKPKGPMQQQMSVEVERVSEEVKEKGSRASWIESGSVTAQKSTQGGKLKNILGFNRLISGNKQQQSRPTDLSTSLPAAATAVSDTATIGPGSSPAAELKPVAFDSMPYSSVARSARSRQLPLRMVEKQGPLGRTKIEENGKKIKKSWTQQYAVLYEGILSFYKDQRAAGGGTKPRSAVSLGKAELVLTLDSAQLSTSNEKSSKKDALELTLCSGTKYLIHCDNEETLQHWRQSIENNVVVMASNGGPSPEKSTPGSPPSSDKNFAPNNTVFGALSIASLCDREKSKIPNFVQECIHVVTERGLDAEGIYRVSGPTPSIQKLRCLVDQNEYYDLTDAEKWSDIHVITSALRLFFRELKEPLLTYVLFPRIIDLYTKYAAVDSSELVRQMRELLKMLPEQNRATLKELMRHLREVDSHSSLNKMQIHNLATVFGPTLMWPQSKGRDQDLTVLLVHQGQITEFMIRKSVELLE